MANFQINLQASMLTATVDFHGSSHAIAYGIGILVGGNYSYNVNGDNKDINNDSFSLPAPISKLIGHSLIFQVVVNRLTSDTFWKATLLLSDDLGFKQDYPLDNPQFTAEKDAKMITINFIK